MHGIGLTDGQRHKPHRHLVAHGSASTLCTNRNRSHHAVVVVGRIDTPFIQIGAHRARHQSQHDVVDGSTERILDVFDRLQVGLQPADPPVGTEMSIDRGLGTLLEPAGRQRIGDRRRPAGDGTGQRLGLVEQVAVITHEVNGAAEPTGGFANEQLSAGWGGTWLPFLDLTDRRIRGQVEHECHQVDPGDAVDHAVVDLRDDREAIALETLHDPGLPQRLRAIELLRHDPAGERL